MVPIPEPVSSIYIYIYFFFSDVRGNRAMYYDDINFCTLWFGRSSPLCTPWWKIYITCQPSSNPLRKNRNRLSVMVGRLGFVENPPNDRMKLVQSRVKHFSSSGVRENVYSCPVIGMSTW